jgi:hypothetical protein
LAIAKQVIVAIDELAVEGMINPPGFERVAS